MLFHFWEFHWKCPVVTYYVCGDRQEGYFCLTVWGVMAGSSIKSEWKHSRPPSKDSHSALPESSLSWCLAHLYRSGPGTENQVDAGSGKDVDKRFRVSQWRALVAIRTQHIKAGKAGIAKFRGYGGLRPLMNLLKQSECPRKTLDLALSILGNCCTEQDTRREVTHILQALFIYLLLLFI